VQFRPKEATVFVANLIIEIQNQPEIIAKLSAIGKYPFISIRKQVFKFEKLLVGQTLTHQIVLFNSSQVSASFKIEKQLFNEYKDNSFSLDCYSGFIPA